MSELRKTGGRAELDAAWAQINALIADVAVTLARAGNAVLARFPLVALIADLTAIRTAVVAAIVDIQAALTRLENGVMANPALADGTTDGKIKTANAVSFRIKGAIYTKAATDDLWDLTLEVDTDATHYRAYWLYLDASGTASFAAGTDALTDEATAIAALPAITATKSVIGVFVAGPSTDFDGAAGLDSFGTFYNGFPAAYTMTASDPAALTASATNSITDGTTAGKLKTRADVDFSIGGVLYRKAATDDLWDLSAETDTTGAQYRAYYLYLDASGTATIGAGSNAASAA
ncbi:MAG: hypothetical protein L0221_14770, partial [Chloroflexi bacterium]|nr:hypothetical protein [Chloroflexota bacterium]